MLADMPLKSFMRLFGPEMPLRVLALTDTLHPGSGCVDETILGEITQVRHLLAHPYDFAGLVLLEAEVPPVRLTYQGQQYQLAGSSRALARLTQRIRALNVAAAGPRFMLLPVY